MNIIGTVHKWFLHGGSSRRLVAMYWKNGVFPDWYKQQIDYAATQIEYLWLCT